MTPDITLSDSHTVAEPALTELTSEQVRAVAEKVYTLWLHDLRLERERRGRRNHPITTQRGGR